MSIMYHSLCGLRVYLMPLATTWFFADLILEETWERNVMGSTANSPMRPDYVSILASVERVRPVELESSESGSGRS